MAFRDEITGLRAIAVISTILFHAGFEIFSGGFVGVDIFFVISGYLITQLIINDIENDRFSIIHFYEKRARRIFPALFCVLIVCSVFSWILMLPDQLKDFSKGLIAVVFFVSNILFWKQAGYFAAEAEENPLLHTWSLSVEEEYYLFFPLFIVLAWRLGKSRIFWMLVFISAVSLILSEWGSRHKTIANFYLVPTRAWELLAGALAAFIVLKQGVKKNDFLALLGLSTIIFSIFAYDKTTPFPSVYALLPVGGVVLLLLYAESQTIVGRILRLKVFIGLGLISYSAYLWHQPLLAFARIKLTEAPSTMLVIILCLCSLVLAFFSWKYIENPFRVKDKFSRSQIFKLSLAGFLLFIFVGIAGNSDKLLTMRYSPKALNFLQIQDESNDYVWAEKNRIQNKNFTLEKRKILVIGDSNSGDFINILKSIDPNKNLSLSSLTIYAKCGPIYINYDRYEKFIEPNRLETCRQSDDLFSKSSTQLISEADIVIFASAWQEWHIQFFEESYRKLIQEFGEKFWWFGNKHIDFPGLRELHDQDYALNEFYPYVVQKHSINLSLKKMVKDRFIDPYEFLCKDAMCRVLNRKGDLLIYDGFHITVQGAHYLGQALKTHKADFITDLYNQSIVPQP